MGSVGGSRHYTGGGLGMEGGWKCPSCGAENSGPIAQGCQLCGAGRPGHRVDTPPPAPERSRSDDPGEAWAEAHPHASLRDAFLAGYEAGVRTARLAAPAFAPEGKVNRTIAAALALFRDQVLAGNPEEVQTGEWLSAAEVTQLLARITEPTYA